MSSTAEKKGPVLPQVLGTDLVNSAGDKVETASLEDVDVVALFFGGRWSVPW